MNAPRVVADWVRVDGETIREAGDGAAPPDAIAVEGAVIAAAYIDLQVNGVGAVDFATAPSDAIAGALHALAAAGTVACLPTLVTAPLDTFAPAIERILAGARIAGSDAASVVGVHLEGPFLGAAPGAHPVDLLRAADVDWALGLVDRFPGTIRIVTLAPEADPDFALTSALANRGVVVALGHSGASAAVAREAADAGARMVTHLFNGMSGVHHREPGLAAAALDDPRLVPSLIPDLVHVDPTVVRIAIAARPDLVAVSDAVATAAGTVSGISIRDAGGVARLADGTLAGSTIALGEGVANLVGIGVELDHAVAMASRRPADLLGLADRGHLSSGRRADLVAVDRDDARVRGVWIGGRPVGVCS